MDNFFYKTTGLIKLFFVFLLFFKRADGQNGYVNPRGIYEYVGKVEVKDDGTYGYAGIIQVAVLSKEVIIVDFYINKGAPGYSSGSFVDTLVYRNNTAVYSSGDCVTTFTFELKGIRVEEKSNRMCWGQGVHAHGFFRKKSSKSRTL
jgi:hypothetical protein